MATINARHSRPRTVLHAWRFTASIVALFVLAPQVDGQDWLQWGVPAGDFKVDATGLADTWPEGGPKQLWKRALGDGYSSILHKDGRLYTMYRDDDEEVIVALDAATGDTKWEHRCKPTLWPDMTLAFGLGPNATPLIVGDRLFAIGVDGYLRCLNIASGKVLWSHDLPAEFGRRKRIEEYGYSGSPVSYGQTIIVQVGGDDHAVVAYDTSGSTVWKSDPGGVSYAPATIIKLAGHQQFIYFSPEGVNGLDPKTGKTLWHWPIEFSNGNHLTPIIQCDDNHIWVASQFSSGGGRLLKITPGTEKMSVEQLWFKRKLRASHWTAVRLGDTIYGSVGGNSVSFVAAFDWKTGKIHWRDRSFHKTQALYADGKLIFLDENGELVLAKVSPEEFKVLASAQVTEAVSWSLPTLVSNKLYLRDRKHIWALDLSIGGS